jgi:hypothetical protein
MRGLTGAACAAGPCRPTPVSRPCSRAAASNGAPFRQNFPSVEVSPGSTPPLCRRWTNGAAADERPSGLSRARSDLILQLHFAMRTWPAARISA